MSPAVKASRHHYTYIRSMQPAVRVRTLNTSIMRYKYLFCLTNRGKCIQCLALEIRGAGRSMATYRFKAARTRRGVSL